MYLHKNVYLQLLNLRPAPPEVGGIIGAKNNIGFVLCEDNPLTLNNYSYSPNVEYLNRVLNEWSELGINLYGFYHTHMFGGYELSKQDKAYIEKVLQQSSSIIDSLYFPIVIPNEIVIAYKANLVNGCINIEKEKIELMIN